MEILADKRHMKGRNGMFTKEKTNICKGVATLLLLFHHLFYAAEFFDYYNMKFYFIPLKIILIAAVSSDVCLWMFVFLSAYGLTYKYIHTPQDKRRGFIPRQWFSLMKPFWFIYVIAFAAVSLTGHDMIEHFHGNIVLYAVDILGWSDFFHTPTLSGAFWFMCMAQIIVLLVPVTYRLLKSLPDYGLISLIFLTVIFLQYMPAGIYSDYSRNYLKCMLVFILGCRFAQEDILNRISLVRISFSRRVMACTALILLTFTLKISYFLVPVGNPWMINDILNCLSAVLICVLFGVYLNMPALDKGLAYIGKYSGSIYPIHAILYFWIPEVVFITRSALVDYFVLLAESLVLSILVIYLKKLTRYDRWLDRAYAFVAGKAEKIRLNPPGQIK